jgi:hypothetical protein
LHESSEIGAERRLFATPNSPNFNLIESVLLLASRLGRWLENNIREGLGRWLPGGATSSGAEQYPIILVRRKHGHREI